MCKCNFVLSVKETSSMHGFAVVHLRLFCRYIAVFFPLWPRDWQCKICLDNHHDVRNYIYMHRCWR